MKRLVWALLGATLAVVPLQAELPKTLDELKQRHAEAGKTPEGALKLWFDACFVFMNPDTRPAGAEMIQYLTIPYKDQPKWFEAASARLFVERLTRAEHQHIFRSYAKGTSPENAYAMDPNEWELNWQRNNPNHEKGLQCYIVSTGADTPRPVYMKQSNQTQLWYVSDHANVYTGIRPPVDPNRETFR